MIWVLLSFFCLVTADHMAKLAYDKSLGCEEVVTWKNAQGQPRVVILHCPNEALLQVQVDRGWVND